MTDLYPLLMTPIFDPRPWGTLDLAPIYPNHQFNHRIGEAWLTGDHCRVANGPLAGKSLSELSTKFARELVGDAAQQSGRFPLLLKFLFPHEKLSVQVHPDDEAAQRIGLPCGKTECWYVAHAQPGSQIALGLKPGVSRAEFEHSIHQHRAEELLNWIDVFAGDMIYVAGGTVHTLGPGAIIVETQQQSDTTYRLYDYGRPRELHLADGLAVMKEKVISGKVIPSAVTTPNGSRNRQTELLTSPCFVVEKYDLNEPQSFNRPRAPRNTPQILVGLEGCGQIEMEGYSPIALAKGDAVVIPASAGEFRVCPQWKLEFLKSSLPGAPVPEPVTRI